MFAKSWIYYYLCGLIYSISAMNSKAKGYFLAALAAAAYGTNPAFAIPLYETDGMNPASVLLFRYGLSLPILALMARMRGRSLRLQWRQLAVLAVLGVLVAVSSLTLFESYQFINSGVASTLLFVYPVMVAVIMSLFFREKFKSSTALCLIIMAGGLYLLMNGGNSPFSPVGFALVMLSSLTYAVYLVMVSVSRSLRSVATIPLMFYVILFGAVVYPVYIGLTGSLTLPAHAAGWLNLAALAVIPTVLSLTCTTIAIGAIGSTPTAIFGALEPVTAVVLSTFLLRQPISGAELGGGLLIVIATSLVVVSDRVDAILLRVRKLFPRIRR